jgi:hypothetical protein
VNHIPSSSADAFADVGTQVRVIPVGPHLVRHVGGTLPSFGRAVAVVMYNLCAASFASDDAFFASAPAFSVGIETPYVRSHVCFTRASDLICSFQKPISPVAP